MEQKQVNLETIYKAIQNMQQELHQIKEIIIEEDEGELREEVKEELERRRKTPISETIPHKEIVKEFL